MHCHICDATLSLDETRWNRDHLDWDPCTQCLLVINSVFDDHLTEEEIDRLLGSEEQDLTSPEDSLIEDVDFP